MGILLYIMTPILAYMLNLLFGILAPIVTFPFTWVLIKVENNPLMYRFRLDMLLQGLLKGFFVVYTLNFILSMFEGEVRIRWVVATLIWLSYLNMLAWDRTKPISYEFSLNFSPILGYFVGLGCIWLL
jgi:hypothetical protein